MTESQYVRLRIGDILRARNGRLRVVVGTGPTFTLLRKVAHSWTCKSQREKCNGIHYPNPHAAYTSYETMVQFTVTHARTSVSVYERTWAGSHPPLAAGLQTEPPRRSR